MAQRQWIKKNDQGQIIAQIDRKKKSGEYYLLPDSRQAEFISSIELKGFEELPSGFFSSGAGLTSSGFFLVESIFNKWQRKIRVIIKADGKSQILRRGGGVSFELNHNDLKKLNEFFRRVRAQGTTEVRENVQGFLNGISPTHFSAVSGRPSDLYSGGEFADLLSKNDVLGNLSDRDQEELNNFIPDYVSRIPLTLRSNKKLKVILDLVDAGKEVYLRQVIQKFEKMLNGTTQNENLWQKFLRDHILVFRNSYGEVLEHINISLETKLPDFMLIDPYSYLDIYEIKRPDTKLLAFDKSRSNYFWDKELAKAISQVENYIHEVQINSDALARIIRKTKSIDINIVRPRGYIIAGRRSQITNETMMNHFRILNESLKNVDILFYDDLLEGLKTFLERISAK